MLNTFEFNIINRTDSAVSNNAIQIHSLRLNVKDNKLFIILNNHSEVALNHSTQIATDHHIITINDQSILPALQPNPFSLPPAHPENRIPLQTLQNNKFEALEQYWMQSNNYIDRIRQDIEDYDIKALL